MEPKFAYGVWRDTTYQRKRMIHPAILNADGTIQGFGNVPLAYQGIAVPLDGKPLIVRLTDVVFFYDDGPQITHEYPNQFICTELPVYQNWLEWDELDTVNLDYNSLPQHMQWAITGAFYTSSKKQFQVS